MARVEGRGSGFEQKGTKETKDLEPLRDEWRWSGEERRQLSIFLGITARTVFIIDHLA